MQGDAPPRQTLDMLEALSRTATWTALALACSVLVILDRAIPQLGVGPLYIPLIALAGWRLGSREACCVALVAAALNVFTPQVGDAALPPVIAVLRGATRLGTYAFIVWTFCALRRVYDRERTAARRDALTGALNRAAFEQHAREVLGSAPSAGPVAVLALTDIDDFKAVNDTGGHAAGDEVLRAFARSAAASLGERERLGRLGGDEFVLLLEAGTVEAARARVEAVHRRLTGDLRSSATPVTVSMGALVVRPGPRPDPNAAMREADRLMYAVKAAGKGALRVEIPGVVAAPTLRASRPPAPALAVP